jgi:putative DNA primase/helicase
MAHCKLDAAVLSESEWYRALGVLGRCIGAEDLAHEWSKPYPRYTPDETAKKLRQAIANSRPVTCNYVATSLGQARFCDECPNRGRVRSPIVLGLPSLEPTSAGEEWPEPENLERELVEVAPFEIDLLPACCQAFAEDLAEEMQVPIDFPAVTILVTLAGVTGRRAKIRPKQYADWEEVGNLWGGLVSEPGTRKTPLIKRILKLVQRLEDEAAAEFDEEMAEYEAELAAHKARATRQLADGETPEPPPETPTCVRYLVNDATVPKFQQILAENPAGVLFFRDEIAAWFSVLDSKGRESDRHFYLEGWDGSIPLTFDRIIRGTVRAATNCISVFGGIQPGVLSRYLLGAIMGGEGDDGFAQRLQVGVYPDRTPEWRYVDCEPNRVAEEAVAAVYRRIVSIPPSAPFTAQFDEDAQVFFIEWLTEHERRIRYEAMPSYLRSHLSKYSGLMVRIALLCHLADDGESRRIPLYQAVRAAKWCQYLESHARRIYAEGSPRSNAAFVGDKIRAGVLRTRFTLRDFRKKNWSGMDSPKVILGILQELEDAGWIRREPVQPTDRGGRPTEIFRVNPKVYPG